MPRQSGLRKPVAMISDDCPSAEIFTKPWFPDDIVSTIYRCLGIRHERHINDQLTGPIGWFPAETSFTTCWRN